MEIKEQTILGGSVEIIGQQNIHLNSVTFQDYISSVLFREEDTKKGRYYYRSELTPFYGRNEELEKLEDFLTQDVPFSIIGITGNGGSGKSRLVYEFLKTVKNWDKAYLDWQDYSNYGADSIVSFAYSNDLILVLDYVLTYADSIGKWLNKIEIHLRTLKSKIRIIIIEREEYSIENTPFWYTKIIEAKRMECFLYDVLHLEALKNEELFKISYSLVSKKIKNISENDLFEHIIKPLERIDPVKKRTIFLLYITDAWLNHNDVRNWDIKELLLWINQNEIKRINELAEQNVFVAEALMSMLCYATMVSGINDTQIPECLFKEYEIIKQYACKKQTNIMHIFNELNAGFHSTIYLEPMCPDLMGEFFCIQFLTEYKLNNGKKDCILRMVKSAIELHKDEYLAFLVRLFQDYSNLEISKLGKLFCMNISKDNGNTYVDFLYQLVTNINNPKFQVMIGELFEEVDLLKQRAFQEIQVENLVYLAIFPFEFPGIFDDRDIYIQDLRLLKESNKKFWPSYALVIYQRIVENKLGTVKTQKIEEIRTYLKENVDEETAYYFAQLLVYLFKTEKNIAYYHELEDIVTYYWKSEKIVNVYMKLIRERRRNVQKIEFYIEKSAELIIFLMVRYVEYISIREVCCDFVKLVKKIGTLELRKKFYRCFQQVWGGKVHNVPKLANIYAIVLMDTLILSKSRQQRNTCLRKVIQILSEEPSKKYINMYSMLEELCNSLCKVYENSIIENERKAFILDIINETQKSTSVVRNYILQKISNMMVSSVDVMNLKSQGWKLEILRKNYEESLSEEILINYIKVYMDYCNHYLREEKEQQVQVLLEYIEKRFGYLNQDMYFLIFKGIMKDYISDIYLEKITVSRCPQSTIPSLENIISSSWNTVSKISSLNSDLSYCGKMQIYELAHMSNKILKHHYSEVNICKYREWIENVMYRSVCDEKYLNFLCIRLYRMYGGKENAILLAKNFALIIRKSEKRYVVKRFLEKLYLLQKTILDRKITDMYKESLEVAILKESGKLRWRYLEQYKKEISKNGGVFTVKSYIFIVIALIRYYKKESQSIYISELINVLNSCDDTDIKNFEIILLELLISEWILDNESCLRFFIELKSDSFRNILIQKVIEVRSANINYITSKNFLIFFAEKVVSKEVIINKHNRSSILHRIIGMIKNGNTFYEKNIELSFHLIDDFVRKHEIIESIEGLIYALDVCKDIEVRKRYYKYLLDLSKDYSFCLNTNIEGKLVVNYNGEKFISKKEVAQPIIYTIKR